MALEDSFDPPSISTHRHLEPGPKPALAKRPSVGIDQSRATKLEVASNIFPLPVQFRAQSGLASAAMLAAFLLTFLSDSISLLRAQTIPFGAKVYAGTSGARVRSSAGGSTVYYTVNAFTDGIVKSAPTLNTPITGSGSSTTYDWYLIDWNYPADARDGWSATVTFIYRAPLPPAPSSPGTEDPNNPELLGSPNIMIVWAPVNSLEASITTSYLLNVRDLTAPGQPVSNYSTSNTSYPLSLIPGHDYRWNVFSSNNGLLGDVSPTLYFRVLPPDINLVPFVPSGWSYPIVLSRQPGTSIDDAPFVLGEDVYADVAMKNIGSQGTAVGFTISVSVNELWLTDLFSIALDANEAIVFPDIHIPADRLRAGQNDVAINIDSGAVILETNESDNDSIRTFNASSSLDAPTNLTAENQNGTLHLEWQYSGTAATGFVLERTRSDTLDVVTQSVPASARSLDDADVLLGKQYCYRLRATNSLLLSDFTASVCATPQQAPPLDATFAADNHTPQPGQSVRFYATSPVPGDTYSWLVDGELRGSGSPVYLTFNSAGIRQVVLKVTDGSGKTAAQSTDINVQSNVSGTGQAGSSGNVTPWYGADPVNLASGNYTYQHADLRLPGIGLPAEFIRFYNSKFNDQSGLPLGYGWSFAPFIRIMDNVTNAVVTFGDGHAETFTVHGADYAGDAGVFDLLVKNLDNSWLLITKEQTTNHIDVTGHLVLIQDRNGNHITLEYEASDPAARGRLKQISDTAGRVIAFAPSPDNPAVIGSITDPIGRHTLFSYDPATTNLISVTDPRGGVTQFAYDGQHRLTNMVDNLRHRVVHNDYDTNLNVVTHQLDAYDHDVWFVFDLTNHITVQTNALGQPSTYYFDDNLLLTNRIDEAGFTTSYAYDEARNQILIRDRNGNETHFAYDARGNLSEWTNALNGVTTVEYDTRNNPVRRTDALQAVTSFAYDSEGNLTDTTNELGQVTHVGYDARGLPVLRTDARGVATTNHFDAQGNLVAVIDTKGGATSFEYDGVGRKQRQVDALSRTNQFYYDNNDNVIGTVDPLGHSNAFTFDANNNLTSSIDSRGALTTNQFDIKDRLFLTTNPLGGTNLTVFDALDRRVASIDPKGNRTSYELSPIDYLLSVTNAISQVTRYTYDPSGNQLTIQDAAGNTTTSWFDPLNRRFAVTDPLVHNTFTGYDALNRIIDTTNASGQVTLFKYDALGHLTNVLDTAGGTMFFAYDENGNRTVITDPNGHSWTNHYDNLNRLIEQDDPKGKKSLFFYDVVGNLTNRTTPNGTPISYQYDPLNRVTNVVYPDGSSVGFTFDEVGNRTRMLDRTGVTTWSYDLMRRLVSSTDPFGLTVSNTFDSVGNRTGLRYPDGRAVLYGFDALNRMRSLTNWLGGEVQYSFDARGLLTHAVNANGTSVDFGYDAANHQTNVQNWLSTATLIASEGAALDALGNQTRLSGTKPLLPIVQTTNVSYVYDPDNRLTSINGSAVEYDDDGNITVLGKDSYRYDSEDRLLSYAVGDTFGGQLIYDGLGNRLQRTTNALPRRYVLDRLGPLVQVLAETDTSGSISAYYVYGYGLSQRITPDGKTATYHFDLRGSTVTITSDGEDTLGSFAYDAFGVLVDVNDYTDQPFRYLGRYGIVDDGNGLYFARARYYHSRLGRFLTKDALPNGFADTQSLDQYVYALNNPMIRIDVNGHFSLGTLATSVGQLGATLGYFALGVAETIGTGVAVAASRNPLILASGAISSLDTLNNAFKSIDASAANLVGAFRDQSAVSIAQGQGPYDHLLAIPTVAAIVNANNIISIVKDAWDLPEVPEKLMDARKAIVTYQSLLSSDTKLLAAWQALQQFVTGVELGLGINQMTVNGSGRAGTQDLLSLINTLQAQHAQIGPSTKK